MTTTKRHRFEVGEDTHFQKCSWKFQKVGFIALLLFVVCGLLGVFGGGGWLSDITVKNGPLIVAYERLARFSSPTEMQIRFIQTSGNSHKIELNRAFVEGIKIDQIFPPPTIITVTPDSYIYFYAEEPAAGDLFVTTFSYTPKRIGKLSGRLQVGDSGIDLQQIVFP